MPSRLRPVTLLLLAVIAAPLGATGNAADAISCGAEPGPDVVPSVRAQPCPLVIFVDADRDVAKRGKLPQVAEYFRACGYSATYFDPWKQWNDAEHLAGMIRHAVRCQGRRVMLVGWSYGAVTGLKALDIVAREGICVDSFVELDCFFLTRHVGTYRQASNAGRVIVIHSRWNGAPVSYLRPLVYRPDVSWHLNVPTNRQTLSVLFAEARRLRMASRQIGAAQAAAQAPATPSSAR